MKHSSQFSGLLPFFPFYGSKWSLAKLYGAPVRDFPVIETCAGAAGYSTYWAPTKVTLVDIDPVICSLWEYLIRVKETEILSLPSNITHIDEAKSVCEEARYLIGFWFGRASTKPRIRMSSMAYNHLTKRPGSTWTERTKQRVASQVHRIRNWKVENKSFEGIENVPALWFIDPPYTKKGQPYKYNYVDKQFLANWVYTRSGIIMVCGGSDDNYLPFVSLSNGKSINDYKGKGLKSEEKIWTRISF